MNEEEWLEKRKQLETEKRKLERLTSDAELHKIEERIENSLANSYVSTELLNAEQQKDILFRLGLEYPFLHFEKHVDCDYCGERKISITFSWETLEDYKKREADKAKAEANEAVEEPVDNPIYAHFLLWNILTMLCATGLGVFVTIFKIYANPEYFIGIGGFSIATAVFASLCFGSYLHNTEE